MRFLISVFAFLFLVSCTATGPKFSEHNAVLKPEPGKGLVYVYRVSHQFKGTGGTTPFLIDGEQVGELHTGGYIALQVEPGPHQFRTELFNVDQAFELEIVEGKTYYMKIFQEGFWRLVYYTILVPENQALSDIQEMRYQGN
ncbi:DUF2846 domain-containing protein [Sneathiella sp. HT1-7]|uniref:DUF2846 domain-containing protein n=1 Tax=Sneathiella sp. HT1-7 TaxID=2887192 RepID=UPI001D144367|nr:DUF2846 domain-containing protein [Sneathiella sp. HT1-7]MCC3305925.1 DUF2846 domain-containing protein [Sneathiella sp. HT1-7]